MYQPQPIPTDDIELPKEISALIEQLAANSHEVWARKRMQQGWVFGPQRDDTQKHHPELLPYEELTEEQKAYDRVSMRESIKVLLSLGVSLSWQDVKMPGVNIELPASLPQNTNELYDLWLSIVPHYQACPPEQLARLIKELIGLGEPLVAYEILMELRQHWPEDLRLAELQALALNRVGASFQAIETLEAWVKSGRMRSEGLGILSRAHKDLALKLKDNTLKSEHLNMACKMYYQGFEMACQEENINDIAYTGTNAASLFMLTGDRDQARQLAKTVIERCGLDQDSLEGHHYWLLASAGECALLLEDLSKAEHCYRQAGRLANRHSADLASITQQARWVLRELGHDESLIQTWMGTQAIALFAGHSTFDDETQDDQALKERMEKMTCDLGDWLNQHQVSAGYASGRPGVDLLFHLALKRNGLKSYVMLPRPIDTLREEIRASHQGKPLARWMSLFDDVIQQADAIQVIARDGSHQNSVWFEYELGLTLGMAMLKAEELDAQVIGLGMWSQQSVALASKLPWVIQAWLKEGFEIHHYDEVKREAALLGNEQLLNDSQRRDQDDQQIVAMLFTDVKGFSQLSEAQVQRFHSLYWDLLYEVIRESQLQPDMMNSWGDGFFMVFEEIPNAARLALSWQEKLNQMDWASYDLPAGLSTRMALHAGPAKAYRDPIHDLLNYVGTHVSHTARLEPVTPPGQIFATREYAALCMKMRVEDYQLEYAGRTGFAKNYGAYHAYLVVAN